MDIHQKRTVALKLVRRVLDPDNSAASTALARSPEFLELAEEVAAGLTENPDSSDDWIAKLAENFAQFNDD
ncbi:MAG TPA: hypothetical protein VF179_22465 [Thermoanaerobaculia bacterium]|nr:hypothetical protein [Thermoanaerobaculia bacterium]